MKNKKEKINANSLIGKKILIIDKSNKIKEVIVEQVTKNCKYVKLNLNSSSFSIEMFDNNWFKFSDLKVIEVFDEDVLKNNISRDVNEIFNETKQDKLKKVLNILNELSVLDSENRSSINGVINDLNKIEFN